MSKESIFPLPKKVPLVFVLLALLLGLPGAAAATARSEDDLALAGSAHAESQNSSTGLSFGGAVAASWSGGVVRLQAQHIINSRSSGTSGSLRVVLWATTTVPVFGASISAYTLGSFTLNPLPAGYEYVNVDQTVAYTPPPTGCFYLTVVLQEYNSGTFYYQDFAMLAGGVPDGSGYYRFSFGGANCSVTSGCTQDDITACLLNGRFQARVRYRGSFDNFPADTYAHRKPVIGFANPSFETTFFYFNSADNIEILLKMLDQGNTDGLGHQTIAVLFGSATPLRVELTITDTTNGATRTYTSPFNTGQGGTDFTAFIK